MIAIFFFWKLTRTNKIIGFINIFLCYFLFFIDLICLSYSRYVIGKHLKPGAELCHDFLFDLNIALNQMKNSNVDILHVLPLSILTENEEFSNYIRIQNERFVLKLRSFSFIFNVHNMTVSS